MAAARGRPARARGAAAAAPARAGPPEQHEAIVRFKVFAYEGMIDRATTEIEWTRSGLELVDEIYGP